MSSDTHEIDEEINLPVAEVTSLLEEGIEEATDANDATVDVEEEEESEPAAEEESGPTITDESYSKGEALGLTKDQVEEFGDKAEAVLKLLESKQQIVEKEEVKEEPEVESDLDVQLKAVYDKLESEGYDPDLTSAFKSIGDMAKSALQRAEAAEQYLASSRQTSEHESTLNWFDNKLTASGGDFQDMFGKGTYKDIPKDSEQYKNRAELFDNVSMLVNGAITAGKQMTIEQAFDRAFKSMTYDVAQKHATEKLTKKVAKRDSQTMEPPGNKGSDVKLDADAEALSEVQNILAGINEE